MKIDGKPVSDEAHSFGLSSTTALVAGIGLSLLLASAQVTFSGLTMMAGLLVGLLCAGVQVLGGFESAWASVALGSVLGVSMTPLLVSITAIRLF